MFIYLSAYVTMYMETPKKEALCFGNTHFETLVHNGLAKLRCLWKSSLHFAWAKGFQLVRTGNRL